MESPNSSHSTQFNETNVYEQRQLADHEIGIHHQNINSELFNSDNHVKFLDRCPACVYGFSAASVYGSDYKCIRCDTKLSAAVIHQGIFTRIEDVPFGIPVTKTIYNQNTIKKVADDEKSVKKVSRVKPKKKKKIYPTRHECDICKKRYPFPSLLKLHLRSHTGERPFCCNDCDKTFTIKNYLIRHLRVHTGEKPFKCDYCGRTFARSWTLKIHLNRVNKCAP